jgi:hypothetical protein
MIREDLKILERNELVKSHSYLSYDYYDSGGICHE